MKNKIVIGEHARPGCRWPRLATSIGRVKLMWTLGTFLWSRVFREGAENCTRGGCAPHPTSEFGFTDFSSVAGTLREGLGRMTAEVSGTRNPAGRRILHAGRARSPGCMKYGSAHVDCEESEFIVRSYHTCLGKPATIEEVRRILHEHLEKSPTKTAQPYRSSRMGSARGPRAVVAGPATTSWRTHLPHWKVPEELKKRSARRAAEHGRPAAGSPQPNCMDTAQTTFPGSHHLAVFPE